MDVESSICLSDLVPALRWSRPQQVAEALADPRLPAGWWSSLALSRALGTAGLDWVCERLARLASSRWDHLPLSDVLPALVVHHIDPTLPGWPEPTRAAIAGLGGWQRLRRLCPGDLAQPANGPSAPAGAELVLGSVFREILGRIPAQGMPSGHPESTRPVQLQRQANQPESAPRLNPQTGPLPVVPRAASGAPPQTGPMPALPGRVPPHTGPLPAVPPHTGPLPAVPPHTGPLPAVPPQTAVPGASPSSGVPHTGPQPAVPQNGAYPGAPSQNGAFPQTGPLPAVSPETGSRPNGPLSAPTGPSPLPQRPQSAAPGGPSAGAPTPGGPPSAAASPGGPTGAPTPAPSDTDHAMVRVVDSLFRSLDKLELAVAVHRLFAEDPVSLRTLAHKMLVDRDVLSQAQRTAEERVLHWLRSSESAPVTGHMFRLTEWLGTAATQDQLIGADPAHPVTVPSLRSPLWRVLVTLMPDRRLQDGWLVVGDLHGLQGRTRQLLAAHPNETDPVALLTELGIRAHSAKEWLDALPSEASAHAAAAAPAPAQPLPRRTPGANGHHHRGGQPIPTADTGSIDPTAALATLSALSGGRPAMLPGSLAGAPSTPPAPIPGPSSDPRRWQRIDVTPEHLRGGPVPVPEGYAAQLGMRPGTLLSVTGPGDNAIVLVWQGHQPVFDSLQPVLMRLNARPGDQVYVTVDGYRLEAQLTG